DCIDESGKFSRRGIYFNLNGDVYANLLLCDFLENGSNLLILLQAFKEVGRFDQSLTAAEDWDMWLRLAARYHFVAVSSPQILYRVSASSMSTDVWRLELACLQVIERAFNQAPASLQHLKKYSMANLYKYLAFKVLEGFPQRQRGIAAMRFLGEVIRFDPAML
ncbi:MAG TPA: glycosyl transferase family A, partial [Cyanobacteria bacterium UBA11162]|nr:glycosyl transferase family A [Cyanobacteria bacterium UBA11162]